MASEWQPPKYITPWVSAHESSPYVSCGECGALLIDTTKHTEWHFQNAPGRDDDGNEYLMSTALVAKYGPKSLRAIYAPRRLSDNPQA